MVLLIAMILIMCQSWYFDGDLTNFRKFVNNNNNKSLNIKMVQPKYKAARDFLFFSRTTLVLMGVIALFEPKLEIMVLTLGVAQFFILWRNMRDLSRLLDT